MEYKEFLAVLLVLGILGVEPAGAVEIGSLNQVNSPDTLNSCAFAQSMVKENTLVNQDRNNGLNKLKMHTLFTNHKKTFKLILNKVKGHKYHKLSRNSLTTTHNKGKLSHSSSNKVSTKDSTKSTETSVTADDKNIKNNEINMCNTTGANGTVLNQTGNETVINETAFNQTVENETNINGTILNNITDENKTDFNEIGNGTVTNETNINGPALNNATDVNGTVLNQTDNSTESTKSHVLNTIENAGYFFAAVAAGAAALSACDFEPATKTILAGVAVVAAVVAAACFVMHVLIDWLW